MPYLGTPPQSGFITSDAEKITGQTTNYVNLSNAISSLDDVQVHVNYVIQDPSTLTLNSTTQIGLGDTLVSSDVVLVTYLGQSVATQSPPVGGVTNDMLAGSITAGKLSSTAVDNTNTNSTLITAQTEKTTLVDADKFLISDSAASGALKYVQKSNLPSGTHVKLLGGSASSAVTHNFGTFMDPTKYNVYMVHLSKVIGLLGNTYSFQFSDVGGEFGGLHYWYAVHGQRSTANEYSNYGENEAQAPLGTPLAATSNTVGSYKFWIFQNANQVKMGSSVFGHNWGYRSDYGDYIFSDFSITYDATDDITGFEIHASGNDATTFDYEIYGITK